MAKDMTNGDPAKGLIVFAIPMILGNLFQQLYNIIDTIIVGNFVGEEALAAVGASTSLAFLFIALATGMSIGSSVVISRFFGGKQLEKMKTAIYTIIFTALVISIVLTMVGLIFNKSILKLMNTPDNIFDDASVYLGIYFLGLTFLFMYNTFNAIFNALGKSTIPLVFLIFSSGVNVVLDLLFVAKFQMGVAGAAYATLIAQGISAVLSFIVLMYNLSKMPTENFKLFDLRILGSIAYIAIPSTIQQSIVSFGLIFVQSLVNTFGSTVMAGYTAATKVDSIAIMPMIAVGNAMSTFTAQNIGANKLDRIKKGYKAALMLTAIVSITVTLLLFIFGDVLIGAFVDSTSSQAVINVGTNYLRVVSIFYIIMGTMNSTNGILRGAGDIKWFMASTLCNFFTRVAFAYLLAYIFKIPETIWYTIPIGWGVGLIISFTRYKSNKWKSNITKEPAD